MTPEPISIFGVAVMLSVQLRRMQSENRQAQKETARAIGELRERMARLEGLFEGCARQRRQNAPGA